MNRRLVQLDLLRCVAIVLVLGRHMVPCPSDTNSWLARLTSIWQRGGWIGVDLFFVLSGFLVSSLLFREYQHYASVNVPRFLIRRGFKIYPAFWLLLAATIIYQFGASVSLPRRPLMGEVLFLQNYLGGLWYHTWSLAVEEHFYLLLACLTMRLLRVRRAQRQPFACLPAIFLVTAILCFSLRLIRAREPFDIFTHLFDTRIRIDALFFGVLLSYYWHFKGLASNNWMARQKRWLIAAGAMLLLPAFLFEVEHTIWIPVAGLTIFYIGSGAILLGMLYTKMPDSRAVRAAATVGTFSYSIYLWHMPVRAWLIPAIERHVIGTSLNWYTYAAVYLVGALVVGIQAGRLIEFPLLRVRDRLYPRERQSDSVTSGNFQINEVLSDARRDRARGIVLATLTDGGAS